jgi:serine/threonine protein kinase
VFQPTTFGKYFLTRRLAVGGMAEVFLAKLYGAEGFEKDLVIKQILPQHARDPEFVQSFVGEAKIAVSLNHANIVGIYELGRVDGTYFIAMEYVDGLDVFQVVEAARKYGETVSPGLALLTCEEVAKGLDYAHRKRGPDGVLLGLVHRDLNPRNVLVSKEGEVKILDFGIAKTASKAAEMPKTRAGVVKGTTGYMSPEQATGRDVDARTDIYQTGLLLHELLTGEALFWRPDEEVTRNLMRRHEVTAPSAVNPSLPPEIDQLCRSCLARNPSERPQSAADLAQRIARLRFLYFPEEDNRNLGGLVSRLVSAREDEVARTELPPEIPNTVELSDVISEAIAHSISDDIETIATRFPAAASPAPGSTPLEVASDSSVAPTPAHGMAIPAELDRGLQNAFGPLSLDPPNDPTVPVAPMTFPPPASAAAANSATEDAPASGIGLDGPSSRKVAVVGALAAAGLVAVGLWVAQIGSTTTASPAATSVGSTEDTPPSEPGSAPTGDGQGAEAVAVTAPVASTPSSPTVDPATAEGPADPASERTVASTRSPGPTRASRTAPAPTTVAFGTRSCSSRVTVDGRVVTRTTPSYDHQLPAGRHRVVVEGTACPPVERPGSLRRVVPVVVSEVDLPPGSNVRIIADFERNRLVVKTR